MSASLQSRPPDPSGSEQRLLIVDTDPGIDDAMALLYLKATGKIRLLALTTVFGNASIDVTTRNARYLVDRFGLDAPVFPGAANALNGRVRPFPTHVHGHDGLGDVLTDLSRARSELEGDALTRPSAHEALIELTRQHSGHVSILALGPLTNLALALCAAPSIVEHVQQVVVMGGAFGWAGRRGNASPVAEANIYNDVDAAAAVFAASWPVAVVGLDVTSRCVLDADRARSLAAQGGAEGRFLFEISRSYERLYREHDGLAGCCLHDVAAAIYLLHPELFSTRRGPIHIAREGDSLGQTLMSARPPTSAAHDAAAGQPQLACSDVDIEALVATYLGALRSDCPR